MQAPLMEILGLGLPIHNQVDLGLRERGQDVLRLFQLVDSWMDASGPAFVLRAAAQCR